MDLTEPQWRALRQLEETGPLRQARSTSSDSISGQAVRVLVVNGLAEPLPRSLGKRWYAITEKGKNILHHQETGRPSRPNRTMKVTIHSVERDGFPPSEGMTGRVAFIWDGNIVSGWPLLPDRVDEETWKSLSSYESIVWESSDDALGRQFVGVTHWVEFPVPIWEIS